MKRSIALLLVLLMVLALAPGAEAAMPKLTAADVLPLADVPNRYQPMSSEALGYGCWIVPEFETYGKAAVIGDLMEIRGRVCAEALTDDAIVGLMIFEGTYDDITEDSVPVVTQAYYAVGGHGSYTEAFDWKTAGFSAGDYTAYFFIMDEEENVVFASVADLYLSEKEIPVTGIDIYVYELDDTPDEIALPQDGAFSYGVIYEPYHTTSSRDYQILGGDGLSYGGSEKPDGAVLVWVRGVDGAATLTITYDGAVWAGAEPPQDTLRVVIRDESEMAVFANDYIRSCNGAWAEVPIHAPVGTECMIYNGNPYQVEIKIENNTLYARGLCHGEGELSVVSGNAIDRIEIRSGDHSCREESKVPTCTEDGYVRQICEYCGALAAETVKPAEGHKPEDVEVVEQPTATKDGVGTGHCSRCDQDVEVVISRIFIDTKPGKFYSEALDYCYANGIINGMSENTFGPDHELNRGQLVTMLHRLAGSPAVEGESPFTDVHAGAYYADAVIWANRNGIVMGYDDGTFRPDEVIIREQIVTMLHRYVVMLEKDNGARDDLSAFTDLDMLHSYALEPMQWAVANGVVNGMSETVLGPRGYATRAQTVTMLHRIIIGILEAE